MLKRNSRKLAAVFVVIVIVALSITGFAAWRLWDSNQKDQGIVAEPSDLPNQDPNTQPQLQPQPTPSETKDPNEGYVVIKEWGVRFKAVEGLEGVEYYRIANTEEDFFAFTTKELIEADRECSPASNNIVLGGIKRSREKFTTENNFGPIQGYYYSSRASSAACASVPNLSSTVTRFLESITSLEELK